MALNLRIVDAIGPFFAGLERKRINWSKIPFDHVHRSILPSAEARDRLRREFETFIARAAADGATALSLDDVAHLAPHPDYPPELLARIDAYRSEFERLLSIAEHHRLPVYLTSDVMFAPADRVAAMQGDDARALDHFARCCCRVLDDYPQIAGIIIRLGECDGNDVVDDFTSFLHVRTPRQARRWLRSLLPLFEARERDLVVRTWTVGAYPIGDLIWNRTTFTRTFAGFESDSLILSIKYGESDFFRFLPLNKNFLRTSHRKIIELQSKREYEGAGEYPSFVGFDYDGFRHALSRAENVIGCMVWCQTGGWTKFRRRTYLEPAAIWNEINTFVTLAIFGRDLSVEDTVREYHERHLGGRGSWGDLLQLLRLSDEVVKELLYVDDFARQKLFFRRTRVPTLLSVYWDRVLVNHSMRKLLRCFTDDGETKVQQGWAAVDKIGTMRDAAHRLGLPEDDLDRMRDTFSILAKAREYYFRPFDTGVTETLRAMKTAYKSKHARHHRYAVKLDFQRVRVRRQHMRIMLQLALRRQRGYRFVDRLITVHALARLYPVLRRMRGRIVPESLRNQAMGLDTVFK